ncbi:acyl-CoA dehydrogenase family protein [Rhodopila sp.]|uniref:acyl-CoA dehydrogenase family protein n=1 Tax=Rhodopila sp. TaxID=2480087 RepID=UPI002B87E9EE|nr:acyl-CoA dehydrogenase family protein [Rhodopila sp.]HVZ06724.1 acyl-CoA dehydrogenase family protein [Rhodopila sp.]
MDTLGSWELPEELVALRETVRRFMASEVKPVEDALPHDTYLPPPDILRPLQQKARSLGLWFVQSPAEFGGAGLNVLAQCVVAEEAAKCRMGAYFPAGGAFGWDPPNVIFSGTPAQIEKYGKPTIASGEATFVAVSEASGGADPARAITTRARREGDHYVLNGAKMWISGIDRARWGVVFARMEGTQGRGGITSFIIEPKWPGITLKKIPVMRSFQPFEVHFDNVRVPSENRLGEEGQGFQLAEKWLVHGRIPYAAVSIGLAQAALDLAADWVTQRKTFGSLLAEKQAIQWMIADSEIELRAARLLTWQAAWKADLGQDAKVDSSICKVYATETSFRVLDRCIQMFGGLGVSHEMPLERWFREARIRRIGEGPSEVHRMVLARDILSRHGGGRHAS